MPLFPSILEPRQLMFLRAALGPAPVAEQAYRTWRATEKFENTDDLAYRMMPLLAATADRAGLQDNDSGRMRGVVKHIWLSNMVRLRDLIEAKQALERAGIPVLLFKGGALFARDKQLAALRTAGDYDLLVRRRDARRSVDALIQQGFHSLGMRIELFAESDFDMDTHAVAMTKSDGSKAIDLHWRAMSGVRREGLVEELFASAEASELFGHKVMIPGLAEHLLVAAIRPEPWEQQEILLRIIEISLLLRHCGGELDWQRFETLVARYGDSLVTAPLLALAREETHAPIPADLIDRIWQAAEPAQSNELSICKVPPSNRSLRQNLLLAAIRSLRGRVRPFSWSAALTPQVLRAVLMDCAELSRFRRNLMLTRLWQQIRDAPAVASDEVCFRRGFSVPESEGRWSEQEFAVLEAPVADAGARVARLTLEVVPFMRPWRRRVVVYCYAGIGRPVRLALKPSRTKPALLEVDAAVCGSPERVILALRIPGRISPHDLGMSADHRRLGLFVRSVRIGDKLVFNPAAASA
ncbi:nucleotidyltransferase family protein [Bradyrhizobium diazoefficiens]|nr:nucleotidyltransferase family protein [Bradyrhizobium diazoefficiens]MBR0964616.1 nucleotidyltransferase family protein [Bradyrhizobium diazoefficiens]MBR0978789.1 nucleotidyltransferase family protein [Bradyrhizobium diazoefficiens]MBR1006603.1 nucleotidyltransferase family protein [Bradyrhizobium diazoefficiens]MBR1014541.1 nucleotidyltransferase family protein [Bradyrhizobium diazoefficiens]MBR1051784.1 nucleotidyltransferase family protein [Bradyrhizobium diazoefficiens]